MKLTDMAKQLGALSVMVSVLFGGFFFLEGRYTSQAAFKSLEKRVSLEELRRQLRQAEEEAAYYRQLLRKYPDDVDIKEKLNKAEKRVSELEEEIKKLEKENVN